MDTEGLFFTRNARRQSGHLSAFVAAVAGPKTKVIIASSLWAGNQSIEALQTYSKTRHTTYVPLAQIGNDFVHLPQARFQQQLPHAQLLFENIATWENAYWEYDLGQLAFVRAFKPELLIIRIGENVAGDTVETHKFATHFSRLLDYLHNPATRIVVAGSFWDGNPATTIMRWVCKAHNVSFLPLAKLGNDMSNRAIGQHTNSGVANHPNDKGMLAITDAIWASIRVQP